MDSKANNGILNGLNHKTEHTLYGCIANNQS